MASYSLKDKIPPHNDEAEIATLGAILLDPEAISNVIPIIRADDFYKNVHKKIFDAILNLFNRSEAIDLITLTEELKSKSELEFCGGPAYIASLTSAVPTSANVGHYADIVRKCSIRRQLSRVAAEIIANANEESLEVRYTIEEAEKKIFRITDNQSSGSFKKAKDIIPRTVEAIENLFHNQESYTGIPSDFEELDKLTSGFQNSEFIVIGARPSVGKTALALNMAANITIRRNLPVGFFTLEMSDMALIQRLLSSEARLSSHKIRSGLLRPADWHAIREAASDIYEAPLYIEDTPSLKLLDLRAIARRMKSQQDVKIIFIDYITLITAENRDLARHEQIAEISRSLKALARELDIPVVALSQVRRETEGKRPTLADLRESGSIEQDADVVIFLHREREYEKTEKAEEESNITDLIIAKQRNGPTGIIKIVFIPSYTRFEPLSRESGNP